MSQAARSLPRLTVEQYLDLEEASSIKHEFVDCVIYAMVGATDRHNLIAGALYTALRSHLPAPCQVFMSDMKLRILSNQIELFYYPDILVSCATTDRAPLYREQPILLAEVLSSSTARTDHGEKLNIYRSIPTLQEYIVVAADSPQIEVFARQTGWQGNMLFPGDDLKMASVDLTVPLAKVYGGISF